MSDVRENSGDAEQLTDAVNASLLPDRVQPHGGTLRSGNPGNRGGGRPKESLRRRMRRILGKTLTAIEKDLDALDSSNGAVGVLANPTKVGPVQGPLTRADAVKIAEIAAKYGVGKEDKREVEKKETRYIIRLPSRPASPVKPALESQPVRVIPSPSDQQSDAAREEKL